MKTFLIEKIFVKFPKQIVLFVLFAIFFSLFFQKDLASLINLTTKFLYFL